jgi:hypothetical protein
MLPVGSKYEEEDIINFLVIDLDTAKVIGCSEKCGDLFGIYPAKFSMVQDFQLLGSQLFQDYNSLIAESTTSKFRLNQLLAKLDKKVPEILTELDTSYLKQIYIQA